MAPAIRTKCSSNAMFYSVELKISSEHKFLAGFRVGHDEILLVNKIRETLSNLLTRGPEGVPRMSQVLVLLRYSLLDSPKFC